MWSIPSLQRNSSSKCLILTQNSIQVLFVLPPRLTHALPIDSLFKRCSLMVKPSSRSKSCSTKQENFQIHLRSIRSNCISSLRTRRRRKHSHRRSSTLQMMSVASDSLLLKPLNRSVSLCSLTSDDYTSDDEMEPCQIEETKYRGTLTRKALSATTHLLNSPKSLTHSLRMRPSTWSGEGSIESFRFLSQDVQSMPDMLCYAYPESSVINVTMTESTLSSDFTDDEGSSLPYMPEYESERTTPDLDFDDIILDTPKSCNLNASPNSLSPPPLRSTTRFIIFSDAFERDLATNDSLFLPDAF